MAAPFAIFDTRPIEGVLPAAIRWKTAQGKAELLVPCQPEFSRPPQDWPLALCDFRSVRGDEGLPNQLYFVDRVPADPFAEVDESKMITSGSEFHYSPDHEWWYFPNMNRDEVLFFVFHDSDHSRAWRVVHTAFRDPTVEAAVPRHSVEFRTFAFFH